MYSWFLSILVLPMLLASVLYWKQNLLIYVSYFPKDSRGKFTYLPSRFDLPFEDVWIETEDRIRIHCWFIRQPNNRIHESPTLIYFHGNAGNISHRLPHAKRLYHTVKCNILLVSYRGYGMSEGLPFEKGLIMDARAALRYVLERYDLDSTKIFLLGRSLGGAVALHLFALHEDQIAGCIVENTFTSIFDMVDITFPLLKCLKFLSSNRWDNLKMVRRITHRPILFLSGAADELVPPEHMRRLHNECRSPRKSMHVFPKGTHNETCFSTGYCRIVADFVDKYSYS